MDRDTRNLLANTTQALRRGLEEEFALQLEGTFDVLRDGSIADSPGQQLSDAEKFTRRKIVDAITHHRASGLDEQESVDTFIRETAFTFLNRLAALKMMEARGIVQECVSACDSHGFNARGFKEFGGLAPGLIDLPDGGYRLYLECIFDEIGREVGILFDRTDPASLLWPRRTALLDALARINDPKLADIWSEDETIGWIYQYYNDPEERRKMRDVKQGGSAAPRNSREMAVRNQFFTPRYVVEFLTDNALGRLWYEMTKGKTGLKDTCRYLIKRPTEIFLEEGAPIPRPIEQDGLSKEELLKQPVHIPHRPLKDPRKIRMIDPACGSMHFGLYAFDLFLVIYEEAWESGNCSALQEDYPSKEAFLKAVPALILEHNIHGIDIDPRAAQIAGLALWLRAQRAWQEQGLRPADRPIVTRSNIVCAEPMPGEEDLLQRFINRSFPRNEQAFFSKLLGEIFETMRLAGEAGSLLKIEENVSALVADARAQWKKIGKQEGDFFSQAEILNLDRRSILSQQPLDTGSWSLEALSGIPDEQFWEKAEERIYQSLRDFAESTGSDGYQRRLFADDAACGFAFIDLCRQRYDVALMNPPFGDASLPSKSYLDDTYGDTKGDVYKAFVECFQARLVPAGFLGIISSRTGFFLGGSEDWRTRVVLRLFRPIALADLGGGVLDAMVEVAAYVLRSLSESETLDLTHSIVPVLEKVVRDKQDRFSLPKWQSARDGLKRHQAVAELKHLEIEGFVERDSGEIVRYSPNWKAVRVITPPPETVYPPLVCVRALTEEDKAETLIQEIGLNSSKLTFVTDPGGFLSVPGCTFAYWVGASVRRVFSTFPRFKDGSGRNACMTNPAGDDMRYFRAAWEVPERFVGPGVRWVPLAKGGAYSPFYSDVHLLVDWDPDHESYRGFIGTFHRPMSKPASLNCFFRPGLTWPRRTTSGLAFRVLPAGCIFADKGPIAVVPDDSSNSLLALLAFGNSKAFEGLVSLHLAAADTAARSYEVGVIQRTPLPPFDEEVTKQAATLSNCAWSTKRSLDCAELISHAFVLPSSLSTSGSTLSERAAEWSSKVRTSEEEVTAIKAKIDDLAFRIYGLDAEDRAALTTTLGTKSMGSSEIDEDDEEREPSTRDTASLSSDLLDYAIGAALGRWDLRFATGEKPVPSEPDPFDPLPVCPPGMLQNADGLPATPAQRPRRLPATHFLARHPRGRQGP